MPADTLAGDSPELRPHPRVSKQEAEAMRLGLSAFQDAAHQLRQPVTSTRVAFGAAARLFGFAHALGGAIATPAAGAEVRDKTKWIIAMSSAVTALEFCAHLVPDQPLDTARCESARSELFDFADDVERRAHKHPYRFFLAWWMVAVSTASRYAEAAHEVVLGWGEVLLAGSDPQSSKAWMDDDEVGAHRPLMHRSRKTRRPVPLCPELVVILREHLKLFPPAKTGRIFVSLHGGPVAKRTYCEAWARARETVLSKAEQATILAGRPYDLRHACVSTWLARVFRRRRSRRGRGTVWRCC